MKLKKRIDSEWCKESGDFWYDLTLGGYLNPHDFLKNKDAEKVLDAVDVLTEFYNLLPQYSSEEEQ